MRAALFGAAHLPLVLLVACDATAQQRVTISPADRPLAVRSTPVYSVGGPSAPDWAAFDGIETLEFDATGNLHILDAGNHRVLVLDRNGRLLREVGRQGGGPGEFQRPTDIAVVPDGGVVVYDRIARRFSSFGPDGALRGDHRAGQGEGVPRTIHAHPAGGLLGDVSLYVLNGQLSTRTDEGMRPAETRPIQHYLLSDDAAARVIHRARTLRKPQDPSGGQYLTAFFPELGMTVLPDGTTVVADTAAYELTLVGPSGGVERVLRRPVARTAVTARMRAAEQDRLLAELAEGRAPEAVASFGQPPSREEMEARFRGRIERMQFPDSLPAIRSLRSDAEGRLWVERWASPHGPGPIDVIHRDGTYLGTLAPREGQLPLAFGPGGLAAYVTLDALDVPVVRVVRVELESTRAGGEAAEPDRAVALTFDDLPGIAAAEAGCDAAALVELNQRLIAALRRSEAPAAGLVTGSRMCARAPAGTLASIYRDWLEAGHTLGNHTYSHEDLNAASLDWYIADIERNQALLEQVTGDTAQRWFRAPFLHYGDTRAKHEGLLTYLDSADYRTARVSIDNQEWLFADAYARAKALGDSAVMRRVADGYVPFMDSVFAFFERRTPELTGGRYPPQTLLLHVNELNADRMDALVAMIRRRGYRLISMEEALADPWYAEPDGYVGPRGLAWVHRRAATRGETDWPEEPREPQWLVDLRSELLRRAP